MRCVFIGFSVLASILGISGIAHADGTASGASDASVEWHKQGNESTPGWKINNTSYGVAFAQSGLHEPCQTLMLLLEEHELADCGAVGDEVECEPLHLSMTAYPLTPDGKGDALYTIHDQPDAGIVAQSWSDSDYYFVSHDEGQTYAVSNVLTGSYLFTSNTLVVASVDVTGSCVAGRYWATNTVLYGIESSVAGPGEVVAFDMTYASRYGPLQRIVVITQPEKWLSRESADKWFPHSSIEGPKISGNRLPEAGSDEETFTDFDIVLKLPNGGFLRVPVKADRLDLAHAEVPAGYKIIAAPLRQSPSDE